MLLWLARRQVSRYNLISTLRLVNDQHQAERWERQSSSDNDEEPTRGSLVWALETLVRCDVLKNDSWKG